MSDWLKPVHDALLRTEAEVRIFFRDDDGGWGDNALLRLIDALHERDVPIDVAVIPTALALPMVDELLERQQSNPRLLGFHQHGFRHVNHESEGRKCEFGSDRPGRLQQADITKGRALMEAMFGEQADAIFTPPWNRCTQATVDALEATQFQVLSRNHSAASLDLLNLRELPIALDWQRARPGLSELASELAGLIDGLSATPGQPLGIMLHHAVMSHQQTAALLQLVELLRVQQKVLMRRMVEYVEAIKPRQPIITCTVREV